MQESVQRLAGSLLYEGYALYPYTPEATKNATPTPFGIVYPPAYAEGNAATYDHVQIECVAIGLTDDARVDAEVLFLQATGARHRAAERRAGTGAGIAELIEAPVERRFVFEPGSEAGPTTGADLGDGGAVLSGRLVLSAESLGPGRVRIRARVENTTPLPGARAREMDRAEALQRSLLSTHTMLGLTGGRFASPLETDGETGEQVQACENVNSWPVLAAEGDDAVLGAAILLPDHPRISGASQANMFDGTEIEEALTLHVQTLSDGEQAEIERQDPAVREMIERVQKTTPGQLIEMHGLMKPVDGGSDPAVPEWSEPAGAESRQGLPPGLDPTQVPGEREVVVGGVRHRREGKVVLRPGTGGDPYDSMLDGRTATIRRIYVDYDGRAYLGVTVDDDPMSEVLRESGRFLFFFADEVEAVG